MPKKTFADVLDRVLADAWVLARLVALWCLLAIGTVLSVRLLLWATNSFGLHTTSVELSHTPRIVLQQVTGDSHEYFIVVQPQAWQNSDIAVRDGDEISFQAQGLVNISLGGIMDNINRRHRIESRVSVARKRGGPAAEPDSAWLPERHYGALDHDSLRLARGWTGPDGYGGRGGIIDTRYAARTRNKILPHAPYGALVAAVHSRNRPPERDDGFSGAFLVGSKQTTVWRGGPGTLWFVVNDVWDDQDADFPDKFYIDNTGIFMVRVTVSRK